MIPQVMIDTLIGLVDVVISMVSQVMVIPQMILMGVIQIVLSPLNLEEGVGMTDISTNMTNFNRV